MVRAKRVTTREARFIKIHIFRENKEYFPSLSQLAAKRLRNRAVESMKTLQTDWQHEKQD